MTISLELLQDAILQLIMNKCGLTQREVESAKDGEVKNCCLILTKEEYEEAAFEERKDFKFVIAKNLKAISSYLFFGNSLQFAFMPEVENIADRAFQFCPLTAVCFLKVKIVGDGAFRGCEELIQVFLPVCEELGYNCFNGCRKIKIFDLSKAKKIGEWQFLGCSSLTDLIIPFAKEIGENCFCGCESLESIDSKLDANQFRCTDDDCKENKECPICRGQLQNCLKKGNDPQNRIMIQNKLEEQKLNLLKEAGVEPSSDLKTEETKLNVQLQKKTKDEQIEDLMIKMLEKDEQIQQISTQLEDVKQESEQQIKDLNRITAQNNQHLQEMEHMEEQFEIKVERMVRKFKSQEKENEE